MTVVRLSQLFRNSDIWCSGLILSNQDQDHVKLDYWTNDSWSHRLELSPPHLATVCMTGQCAEASEVDRFNL